MTALLIACFLAFFGAVGFRQLRAFAISHQLPGRPTMAYTPRPLPPGVQRAVHILQDPDGTRHIEDCAVTEHSKIYSSEDCRQFFVQNLPLPRNFIEAEWQELADRYHENQARQGKTIRNWP